jgi:hypothetical protein
VLQALMYRDQAIAERFRARPDIVERLVRGTTDEQWQQQQSMPEPLADPLSSWR